MTLKLYNKIDAANDRNRANEFLRHAKSKSKRTPIENYRIGNVYDLILKDDVKAHSYYTQAVNQSIDTRNEDSFFIWTRLRDRVDINHMFEADDAKYDIFNLNELDLELKELEVALLSVYDANKNSQTEDKKNLEERVRWVTDNQNVHDKNINNSLKKGYDQIKYENEYNFMWEIGNIIDYIRDIYSIEADEAELKNVEPAVKMLEYINKNGGLTIMKLKDTERNFVSNVFTKIFNEQDGKKRKTMLENFILNLKDSYSNGTPVCITGRTARIMSSFTNMDDTNSELGILKDKPIIRNEILSKAASVRNKIYDAAPKDIQDKYNKSIRDDDTKKLESDIMHGIISMINNDYYEMKNTDQDFIGSVIKEIELSI